MEVFVGLGVGSVGAKLAAICFLAPRDPKLRLGENSAFFLASQELAQIAGGPVLLSAYRRTFGNPSRTVIELLEEFLGVNDIAESIWYINVDQFRRLKIRRERFSLEALGAHIHNHIQHKDEHSLISLFQDDFRGYEEPDDIRIVLDFAQPYLPASGVNGEMVLNVGKAVYFARKGLDGVIDISPFSCMNGIVREALYPKVSRDNAGIPIRNFYFDGTQSDLERDLGIFVELAKSYQRQKPWPRQFPRLAGSTAGESMVSGARKT